MTITDVDSILQMNDVICSKDILQRFWEMNKIWLSQNKVKYETSDIVLRKFRRQIILKGV